MEQLLNKIVAYWYDCIKNEDILEKDISINVRSKAVLYPFDNDPFVFDRRENLVLISGDEKLTIFSEYITTQGYEPYYGYPVLFYFDDDSKKYLIAPLFIIKVKFIRKNQELYLQKDEQNPTCGIQAFTKLGFRTEEIADISQSLEKLFRSELLDSNTMAKKCLEVIQKETELPINEPIDPKKLTNSKKISKNMTSGLYNKSLIFAGENTVYNINLLQDLLELKKKNDLDKTALSFILEKVSPVKGVEKIPVLPFPSNEYQVKALQDIFQNKLSVITGPPGTGKSQFISNLLINLFLEGKSVLFVSHTNEAVDVVNQKLNEQFRNLMLRTGKKEFRQELKGKFNELILASSKTSFKEESLVQIQSMWRTILEHRNKLLELDKLEQKFENSYLV
ncbi:MAG: AAA domain-containing protein, partial [Minisyncoccia bacterium]